MKKIVNVFWSRLLVNEGNSGLAYEPLVEDAVEVGRVAGFLWSFLLHLLVVKLILYSTLVEISCHLLYSDVLK